MNTSFNRDAVKAGTGRRFLGGILDENSLCYTLEVSFFCYTMTGGSTLVPYDEEGCILFFYNNSWYCEIRVHFIYP